MKLDHRARKRIKEVKRKARPGECVHRVSDLSSGVYLRVGGVVSWGYHNLSFHNLSAAVAVMHHPRLSVSLYISVIICERDRRCGGPEFDTSTVSPLTSRYSLARVLTLLSRRIVRRRRTMMPLRE